ncbi:MAG TPA: DUF167 domain-containing protein [Anaerolineae bacterium]|nr:DUF167 domain-containing protein [Anaerolineae bacterium]
MSRLKIAEAGGCVTFAVRTLPRSGRDEVSGVQGDALKVKLAAPPVEGAANAALIELLARQLGVRKSAVAIVGGIRSRNKVVRVEGITRERVERTLRRA